LRQNSRRGDDGRRCDQHGARQQRQPALGKVSALYREMPELGHQYLDARTLAELVRWLGSNRRAWRGRLEIAA